MREQDALRRRKAERKSPEHSAIYSREKEEEDIGK